jgi:hypothetical protein
MIWILICSDGMLLMSSSSAVDDDDVDFLRTGELFILPPPGLDPDPGDPGEAMLAE